MSQFTHLPADIQTALDDYDRKVATGEITFDDNGFAHDPYPTDPWMADNVTAHADMNL